jgi:hypothetical protein
MAVPQQSYRQYHSDPSSFRVDKKRAGDSIDPIALRNFVFALQQRIVFAST